MHFKNKKTHAGAIPTVAILSNISSFLGNMAYGGRCVKYFLFL